MIFKDFVGMLKIKDLEFTYDQEDAFKFPDMECPKGHIG